MVLKSIKKLPKRAQKMWSSVYKEMTQKGKSEILAAKIAWSIVKKNYVPKKRDGKKSIAVSQPLLDSGTNDGTTYVDVVLGYPTIDAHGEYLAPEFWSTPISGVLKGDMEHYYADKAEGLYIDDSEDYEGWVPIAQRFWKDGEKLMARVELPENHAFTPTFLEKWKSGEYGLSIEYIYPEEAVEYEFIDGKLVPVIKAGTITGFTFTKTPAIAGTKPKNNTNKKQ